MSNIFNQLNPMVWAVLAALLLGSLIGIWVLRLVRKGKAKNPGDVVKAAKEKMDQQKARKEALKQAEAAIAAPVASSRLSRIGVRSEGQAAPEETTSAEDFADAHELESPSPLDEATHDAAGWDKVEAEAEDTARPEAEVEADRTNIAPDNYEADEGEPLADDGAELAEAEAAAEWADEPLMAETASDPPAPEADWAETAEWTAPSAAAAPIAAETALDLADPANHPRNWDALVAMIDVLDGALKRSWSEDHLAPSLRVRLEAARAAASDEVDDCLTCRSLSAQLAATDLARTINSAAREQAAEIVAVVREFAHSAPFNAQDCGAVMAGLGEIQWMALIVHDGQIDKRTLPLTRHDPEAPLWVAEAQAAMRRADLNRAAAAA
jgi:hypothetical protein